MVYYKIYLYFWMHAGGKRMQQHETVIVLDFGGQYNQ